MNFLKAQHHSDKFTLALFGKNLDLMNKIEGTILEDGTVFLESPDFERKENASFRIISGPKFFDTCPDHSQKIIDFMALSYPGPHRFILAVDSENAQEDKVVDQIDKLQKSFGVNVSEYVVIISENQQSYNSVKRIKSMFNVQMTTVDRNLVSELKEWSLKHPPFQFDYKICTKEHVKKKKKDLERTRNEFHPQSNPQTTGGTSHSSEETAFNIVLLGKTGTGKSASANTILAAGNSQLSIFSQQNSSQFKSYPSSTPVTTKCEVKMTKFGTQVKVVDTPDLFYEEECIQEGQLEECKKYCQPEQCVMLLVIQLGRFTDGERGILENLEKLLGWEIRNSTIVLFTHGEDLHCDVVEFIGERSHLKHIVEACGNRYHVFKNTSKDSKQVKELIKKFPKMFPNLTTKHSVSLRGLHQMNKAQ